MSSIFRRKLAIGGAVLAAVAVGGGAYAATQSNTNPRQAFLNDVAKRLNVSPNQLHSALTSAAIDQLKAAVKAGKLTQAQANALRREIQEHGGVPFIGPADRASRPAGSGCTAASCTAVAPVPGHPGGPGMLGPMIAGPLGAAASYLGMTPPQLFKQLSVGEVAGPGGPVTAQVRGWAAEGDGRRGQGAPRQGRLGQDHHAARRSSGS